jgi:hypothetical protein
MTKAFDWVMCAEGHGG